LQEIFREADHCGLEITVVAARRIGGEASRWDATNGPGGTLEHQTAIRGLVEEVAGVRLKVSRATNGCYDDFVTAEGPAPIALFTTKAKNYINGIPTVTV
jgi:hypothetical protein